MVTMIKHTIPLEEAIIIHLGYGTETLSTRILFNNKPLLLHNIYRVAGELDITTSLTREPRSVMVGDFNARDEMWCRDHNRAGRLLNEQLQNLDIFCLMNHPQVWTTINKTAIDLSLLMIDILPLTSWWIYPGLLSDHLAVLLEIQQYGTRSHTDAKMEQQHTLETHTDMVNVVLTWKEQSVKLPEGRELQNEALCERTSTVLQLTKVFSLCQDMQVGNPDLQILRMNTSLPPMQGQQTTDTQMCKLRTRACHYKSPLPKENGSR